VTGARRLAAACVAAVLAPAMAGAQDTPAFGDAERGAEIWRDCSGCHEIGEGAAHGIGPHLNGIFGRPAAAIDGFAYSESLARMGADGLVWDLRRLDAYIENPLALVSGTRMSYPGLADAQARADLLAFLRRYSDNPRDIPEAPPTAQASLPDLEPEILAIEGDAAFGEYLASECLTCHRQDGTTDGIPSITNWPEENFVVAMHAYKRKLRPHPVMQMMAGRLSDEEIAALAAYFAGLD
jgi:cytochrome c